MKATTTSYLAVIGTNSECSDMINPRGEIYGEVFCLQIDAADGRRWVGPEVSREGGLALAAALQRSIDRGYNPTTSEAFHEVDPGYGTQAYIKASIEIERAYLERRETA